MPKPEKDILIKNKIPDVPGLPALDAARQKEFQKALKRGIYKELRSRNILSEAQLDSLLERNS